MKKGLSILLFLGFLWMAVFSFAIADGVSSADLDLSAYSVDELIRLRNRINDEIASRNTNSSQPENPISTDKEIQFNDFTWGMDAKTALDMLLEKKLVESYASISAPVSVEPWMKEYYSSGHFYEDSGLRISEWCWGKTQVAGYDVQETDAFFYYDYSESSINLDESASHLYKIQVHLTATDFDYAEEDMAKKLTNLYGEPVTTTSDDTITYVWYGANNTALSLYHHVSGSGQDRHDSLVLLYGKTDGEDHLKKIEEIVLNEKREKEQQNSDNYDGL